MPEHRHEPDARADAARVPSRAPDRDAASRARRGACPRCGAPLGALSAGPSADAASLYCGCCGLVLPAE